MLCFHSKKESSMPIQEFTASVLAAPPLARETAITQIQALGIKSLHIDIMDDHYVNNLALSYDCVTAIAKTFPTLNLDIHLMVTNVEKAVEKLATLQPRMITFHPSTVKNIENTTKLIHQTCAASIAINPDEPIETFTPYLKHVDHCLIMGVQPGRCGQSFQTVAIKNLLFIHEQIKRQKLNCGLGIDGGVNVTSLPSILKSGIIIDQAIVGNALFSEQAYAKNWKDLLACLPESAHC